MFPNDYRNPPYTRQNRCYQKGKIPNETKFSPVNGAYNWQYRCICIPAKIQAEQYPGLAERRLLKGNAFSVLSLLSIRFHGLLIRKECALSHSSFSTDLQSASLNRTSQTVHGVYCISTNELVPSASSAQKCLCSPGKYASRFKRDRRESFRSFSEELSRL